MSISKLKTKFFVGSYINNVKEFFNKINEIIEWINNFTTGTGSYTEYTALISQSGVTAPFADDLNGSGTNTAFVNTIGGVWSYNGTGSYYFTKAGAFTNAKKVFIMLGENEINQSPAVGIRTLIVDANTIEIQSGEFIAFANPAAYTLGNGKLYLQPITIKVYN